MKYTNRFLPTERGERKMLDWDTLLGLIETSRTSPDIRFITEVTSESDIIPTITALANTHGGKIIIGMDIKNLHLVGTTVTEEWLKKVVKKICTPFIHFDTDILLKNNKHVVCIIVPEGQQKPYYYYKLSHVLDGKTIRLADDREIAYMKKETEALIQFLEADQIEDPAKYNDSNVSLTPPPFHINSNASVRENESEDEEMDAYHPHEDEDFNTITNDLLGMTQGLSVPSASDLSNLISITSTPHAFFNPETSDTSFPENNPPKPDLNPTHKLQEKELIPLSTRQLKAVRFLKLGNPDMNRIQNKKYRNLYSVSHKTAHIELVDLVSRGILEQEGSGRSTCYRLSEALVKANVPR